MSWVDDIFIVDHKNKILSVCDKSGKKTNFSLYKIFFDVYSVISEFENRQLRIQKYDKESFDNFYKNYGVYPKKFKSVFNAIMLSLWVDGVKHFADRYGFSRGGHNVKRVHTYYNTDIKSLTFSFSNNIQGFQSKGVKGEKKRSVVSGRMGGYNPGTLVKIHKIKDLLEQTEKDGQKNIQPWVFHSEKSPADLKKFFGKKLWKRICAQSYTRNRAMAKLCASSRFVWSHETVSDKEKESLKTLMEFPSELLRRGFNSPLILDKEGLTAFRLNEKPASWWNGPCPDRSSLKITTVTIRDTVRMASQLNEDVNWDWSARKWNEKHDEFTKMIERKRYSPEPFEWLGKVRGKPPELCHKGFTAQFIDNAYDVRTEGIEMNHCVSGYAASCSNMRYMVYSIRDSEGKRYSTLGVNINRGTGILSAKFSQHYMNSNKIVESEEAREFAEIIVKAVQDWIKSDCETFQKDSDNIVPMEDNPHFGFAVA